MITKTCLIAGSFFAGPGAEPPPVPSPPAPGELEAPLDPLLGLAEGAVAGVLAGVDVGVGVDSPSAAVASLAGWGLSPLLAVEEAGAPARADGSTSFKRDPVEASRVSCACDPPTPPRSTPN